MDEPGVDIRGEWNFVVLAILQVFAHYVCFILPAELVRGMPAGLALAILFVLPVVVSIGSAVWIATADTRVSWWIVTLFAFVSVGISGGLLLWILSSF